VNRSDAVDSYCDTVNPNRLSFRVPAFLARGICYFSKSAKSRFLAPLEMTMLSAGTVFCAPHWFQPDPWKLPSGELGYSLCLMKKVAEFAMQDGGVILVEADSLEPAGPTMRGLAPAEIIEKASENFETALGKIRPVAEVIIRNLRDLTQAPDSVKVEFGVKLNASAGAVIAAAAAEANFKVTLTWNRSKSATQG